MVTNTVLFSFHCQQPPRNVLCLQTTHKSTKKFKNRCTSNTSQLNNLLSLVLGVTLKVVIFSGNEKRLL